MMVNTVKKIEWKDYSEAIPGFLAIIGIPLTFTIHNEIALGFMAYPLIKLLTGKWREASWVIYLVAALLILYYAIV